MSYSAYMGFFVDSPDGCDGSHAELAALMDGLVPPNPREAKRTTNARSKGVRKTKPKAARTARADASNSGRDGSYHVYVDPDNTGETRRRQPPRVATSLNDLLDRPYHVRSTRA